MPDSNDARGVANLAVPFDYSVQPLSASGCDLVDVIALGDNNRHTLGFLPRAGYVEAAARDTIMVAATDGSRLVGYTLYDLTRNYVRIVHVCVDPSARGSGVAASLVDAVQERHPDLLGLKLKCRRDWAANHMWPRLGFQPVSDVPGRSRERHQLTVWWRSNNLPDLFEIDAFDRADLLTVAVDTNIFSDLHSRKQPDRRRFSGALALLVGEDRVHLALPNGLASELNETADAAERQHFLHTAASYRKIGGSREAVEEVRQSLLEAVPTAELDSDPSLLNDTLFIAESIVGGADVFTTRDANCVRVVGSISFDRFGLLLIDPTELPTHLDERGAGQDYQPARLAETAYEVVRGSSHLWTDSRTLDLLDRPGGERRSWFNARLRAIAERSADDVDRYAVLGPNGDVLAIWASSLFDGRIEVPLMRVRAGNLQSTITRQLLFLLRSEAVRQGVSRLLIVDPYIGESLCAVVEREGLSGRAGAWEATVLDLIGVWSDVRTAAELSESSSSLVASAPTRSEASELERLWWPVKIIDADVPCYFVPIRSGFADELLGHRRTLLERRSELGLSREHVYYRSSRAQPSPPGRLLWYASGRDQQLVACSRLVDAVSGTPESLHRAYRRLGVWNLNQVRDAAKGGRVGALRFADTEIFSRPVSLSRIRELSAGSAMLPSRGPLRISAQLFAALYAEGRNK